MPDEIGTETTLSDAPSAADGSPFAEAAEGAAAAVIEEESPNGEAAQEPQGSDEGEEQAAPPEELKVVVSIKGGRATIGVQQPKADPHVESFDNNDLSGLAQEIPAVAERARVRWEDEPKYPAHVRPAPPARRQTRRGQGSAQAAPAEAEQTQQQTLRLF